MTELVVQVTRHEGYKKTGSYVSKVYSIRGSEFLTYDPGSKTVPPHFEWVDMTELVKADDDMRYAVEKV